ncbi:MAG: gamma carbonic anhydrase family protein [Faecalicoccus sp.]|nr:gamma carbonic anhydrase family protein [Faecalicoccus sp.]
MKIDQSVYVAEGAVIRGNVTIEKDCSVWFNAVIRAEDDTIWIQEGSNVQDNCVIHVDEGYPVSLGKGVTVGHSAILHGCTVKENTVIGMGAIVLNGAVIGKNCIVAAGALVPQNAVIEDNTLVMGTPAKVRRILTEEEINANRVNAQKYISEAKKYGNKLI